MKQYRVVEIPTHPVLANLAFGKRFNHIVGVHSEFDLTNPNAKLNIKSCHA